MTRPGVFLVLAAKAPATVFRVSRSDRGKILNIGKKTEHACHYNFHIMDPDWGHVTIKVSGHPPFPAQVILNGHEIAGRRRAAVREAEVLCHPVEGREGSGLRSPPGQAKLAW